MKIKNIDKLKQRLEEATSATRISELDNTPIEVRYDTYEGLIYLQEDGKDEIMLSIKEAQKLRNVLNSLL